MNHATAPAGNPSAPSAGLASIQLAEIKHRFTLPPEPLSPVHGLAALVDMTGSPWRIRPGASDYVAASFAVDLHAMALVQWLAEQDTDDPFTLVRMAMQESGTEAERGALAGLRGLLSEIMVAGAKAMNAQAFARERAGVCLGAIPEYEDAAPAVADLAAPRKTANSQPSATPSASPEPFLKDARGARRFEIKARAVGGCRLQLFEGGTEVGGGIFYDDCEALTEGDEWLSGADAPIAEASTESPTGELLDSFDRLHDVVRQVRGAAWGLECAIETNSSRDMLQLSCATLYDACNRLEAADDALIGNQALKSAVTLVARQTIASQARAA